MTGTAGRLPLAVPARTSPLSTFLTSTNASTRCVSSSSVGSQASTHMLHQKFSESLLKEFGLVLVSRFPACVDSRAQSEPDYTRSIPIGLAIESNVSSHQPINLTRKMETPYPTLSVSCSDVDDTQYATISAGLNHFTEHERRFRSLIHTYRLIISSESENTLGPFKASNSNEPETGATTAAAGPQWRLWLTEASCMM